MNRADLLKITEEKLQFYGDLILHLERCLVTLGYKDFYF